MAAESGAAEAPRRSLFFLHIRKTAGVSVRALLVNRFAVRACLLDCHHVANRGIDPEGYHFVTGHVGFDYSRRFARRPLTFVVLRRPLERALSAYHFFRCHDRSFLQWLQATLPPDEGAQRVQFTRRANELTLLEFLEQESALARAWLSNPQTRALAGGSTPADRSDRERLAHALRNLASCDVVGLTERLDESLAILGHQLGWEGLGPAPHENVTTTRPAVDDVDPRALAILSRWNDLDAELYAAAEGHFARGLETMRRKPAAGHEVPSASDGAAFTFDQAIHGRGWYPREQHQQGWLCWMGAERQAWIDLHVPAAGDHLLECGGVRALRPSVLDGLRVRVNGQAVALARQGDDNDLYLEARVPAQLLDPSSNRLRLTFEVNETFRPSDLVPGNRDRRALGIALASIQLKPLAG